MDVLNAFNFFAKFLNIDFQSGPKQIQNNNNDSLCATDINSSKKVSIIMPVYNGQKYLAEAIESIENQSYKNWELIIINDGSTDRTESVVSQYADDRIRYYKNDTNLGLIGTLNKAIDLCNGEYIARMDADDISKSSRIDKQVRFLDKHKDISMCGTNAIIIDEIGNNKGNILNVTSCDYIQINLLFTVPIVHPSMMIRSSVLKQNKYNPDYKHVEDYELWCRIAKNYKIANLSQKLLKYRWHTSNISVQFDADQELKKNVIIGKQLDQLNIKPTKEELYLHRISFKQYDAKKKLKKEKFDDFDNIDRWFNKLIEANNQKKLFNQKKFIAFLWSRWIVICIKQKQYNKIFGAKFLQSNISIYWETLKLIAILAKK